VRRRGWALGGAAVLVAAAAAGGAVALSGGGRATAAAATPAAATATVREGRLAAAVSQDGTLTYRARPDGSPFTAINNAGGTYTALPAVGDEVGCGHVLYRVDDRPVLLLCGTVPAYRALRAGARGRDVRQLNRALRVRGAGDAFTAKTEEALEALQRRRGARATGALARGDVVVLPEAVRIAKLAAQLGGAARPGAPALSATSRTLHVQVDLAPADQAQVARGDRALVTLPGNRTARGRVDGFGRIAEAPAAQGGGGGGAADATIPTSIGLDDPRAARGLDRAPVGVEIAIAGVARALSVPVTALVGRAGGGFAVEAVRAGGRRELVAVRVGLFDTAGGRVQVEGALRAGDRVAVPSP